VELLIKNESHFDNCATIFFDIKRDENIFLQFTALTIKLVRQRPIPVKISQAMMI